MDKLLSDNIIPLFKKIKNIIEEVKYTTYFSIELLKSSSMSNVNSKIKISDNFYRSNSSYFNYRKNYDHTYLKKIRNTIFDYIYNNSNEAVYAVDGSYFNFYDSDDSAQILYKDKRNAYLTGTVSSVYDILNNIPYDYALSNSKNEGEIFRTEQLKKFKKGDTFIFDRKYYSFNFAEEINNNDMFYIFRMKDSHKGVKALIQTNTDEILFETKFRKKTQLIRILKYEKDKTIYYIATNIIDTPINHIKKLYKLRWNIETDILFVKHRYITNNIRSKRADMIKLDMEMLLTINLLTSYLINKLEHITCDNEHKINKTNFIDIMYDKLLYYILISKHTKKIKKIFYHILDVISNILIKIIPNRHFDRIRKMNDSKWGKYGNKYKRKK